MWIKKKIGEKFYFSNFSMLKLKFNIFENRNLILKCHRFEPRRFQDNTTNIKEVSISSWISKPVNEYISVKWPYYIGFYIIFLCTYWFNINNIWGFEPTCWFLNGDALPIEPHNILRQNMVRIIYFSYKIWF